MQHTLKQSYTFSGKGLHTGLMANMTVHPAPAGSGKLEPEEKLILVILFYLIARWILRF